MTMQQLVTNKQARTLLAFLGGLILTGASFIGNRVYLYDGRLTTLETAREMDSARLERIEDKLDRILERQP